MFIQDINNIFYLGYIYNSIPCCYKFGDVIKKKKKFHLCVTR